MAQDANRRDEAIKDRNAAIAALAADRAQRSEGRAERGEARNERKEGRDIWKQTIDDFTTKKAGLNGATEVTDWAAAAKDFEIEGHTDLADRARSRISNEIDYDSDKYLELEMKWRKEANKKDPVGPNSWRKDAMKEEFGDLTPDEWIKSNAEAEYRQSEGIVAPAAAAGSPAADDSGKYETKEDVKEAYMAGKISREEARKLLIPFGGS